MQEILSSALQETQKTPNLSSEQPQTPKKTLKPVGNDTGLNPNYFQNIFMKKMEAIKAFTKSTEKKFEELENALIGSSHRNSLNCSDNSLLVVDLKAQICTLENLVMEKDAIIDFLLKQKQEVHEISKKEIISAKTKNDISKESEHSRDKKTELLFIKSERH